MKLVIVPSFELDSKFDSLKSWSIKFSGSTLVESTLEEEPTFSRSNNGPDDRAEFLPEFLSDRSRLPYSDAISLLLYFQKIQN